MSNIAENIPEIPLRMDPQTEEARAFIGFKWSSGSGGNHKIGGTPDWIQGDATPGCPHCDTAMAFIAQIDSVGDGLCFSDCGMIYLFMCRNCGEITTVLESC
jgi:hypothetical protein